MLSNIEIMMLSILNEGPSYGYEINKTIDNRDMRRWVRSGEASVYQVLRRLEKKDLVYSRAEKNLRKLNRYYITDFGIDVLHEASKRLLSNFEWCYLDLNVGLGICDFLSTKEIVNCLTKRLLGVTKNLGRMKEIYLGGKEMDYKKKAIIRNLIRMREVEKKFIQEILQEQFCVNK